MSQCRLHMSQCRLRMSQCRLHRADGVADNIIWSATPIKMVTRTILSTARSLLLMGSDAPFSRSDGSVRSSTSMTCAALQAL
jgi:hypothetical protein